MKTEVITERRLIDDFGTAIEEGTMIVFKQSGYEMVGIFNGWDGALLKIGSVMDDNTERLVLPNSIKALEKLAVKE